MRSLRTTTESSLCSLQLKSKPEHNDKDPVQPKVNTEESEVKSLSRFYSQTHDIKAVQKSLNHTSSKTTEKYAHLVDGVVYDEYMSVFSR